MLSSASARALRIRLNPSPLHLRLIYLIHASTLLPIVLLVWQQPLYGLLLLPLGYSLLWQRQVYAEQSRWGEMRVTALRRVERYEGQGRLVYRLSHTPLIQEGLIVLGLERQARHTRLLLFRDRMSPQQWHALRRFLRFHLEAGD